MASSNEASRKQQITQSLSPGIRLLHVLIRINSAKFSVAFSPDGLLIASGGRDKTVRLWDVATGKNTAILRGHEYNVSSVAFSPDGLLIVSGGGDSTVRLWDVATGKNTAILTGHEQGVYSVAFSPDGLLIASGGGDRTVRLWDVATGKNTAILRGHEQGVYSVAFSPDGLLIASGGGDRTVRLWDVATGKNTAILRGHEQGVYSVAFSPDGLLIASGGGDRTVRLWDVATGKNTTVLEGHNEVVTHVAFSPDGKILASKGNGEDRLWRLNTGDTIATIPQGKSDYFPPNLTFHPRLPLFATIGSVLGKHKIQDNEIQIYEIDFDTLLNQVVQRSTLSFTSAKIVLVGESSVGKSSLAMRLAENRYPEADEEGTTHGMRFWPMTPEQLHPSAIPPTGERRDIVLWDLGGQEEYRLVHQLFLHDTTVALILLDPTRGRTAFDDAEEWNKRLDKQLGGRSAIKLLVGAKMDRSDSGLDRQAIESLCKKCGFRPLIETSALTGRNIEELQQAIAEAIPWEDLTPTHRPELFQRIRDEIEERRRRHEVILYEADLVRQLSEEEDVAAVDTVVHHLALQGVVARSHDAAGEPVVVLQIPQIEQYAGSLILAAKNNPRGVPALEWDAILQPGFPLPRLERRLDRLQERAILECTIKLLLKHGVCFQHAGLLIFPTSFPTPSSTATTTLPHSISLYYDFSGAIDNVYASLVTSLALAEKFGRVRLWPERAEFEIADHGLCGLRKIGRPGGFAHIDIYFEEDTPSDLRALFTSFVEEHLREHDIEIREHIAVRCPECSYDFAEDVVQTRIGRGKSDVSCPVCDARCAIAAGAEQSRERDSDLSRRTWALRSAVAEHRKDPEARMDENKALTFLEGIPPGDFARVLNRLPGARGQISARSHYEQVAELWSYCRSSSGPGLPRLLEILGELFPEARTTGGVSQPHVATTSELDQPSLAPLRILHLSDLHFTGSTPWEARLQYLVEDIKRSKALGFDRLDYLVVSGDFTDKGNTDGYDVAYRFLEKLISHFDLSAQRCILVPGNHDVAEPIDAYIRRRDSTGLQPGTWVQQGSIIMARDLKHYKERFHPFSNSLYHPLLQRPYPLEFAEQGLVIPFWEGAYGLQFFALNSCWELDEFDRKRSSILPGAVAYALEQADAQEKRAHAEGTLQKGAPVLRLAVWHHAVAGPEQMKNTDFIGLLQNRGVKLGLHGDVHELRQDEVGYQHEKKMHISGAGSFGAPAEGRPEATPRLYSLIEISRDLQSAVIHTREQRKPDGPWQGWYEWDDPNGGNGKVPYYRINWKL